MSTQEEGLTGYSLSLCICDILRGAVAEGEVGRIVASTNAPTRDDFLGLLESYANSYWTDDPARGKDIALRFYDAGKIDQPRTRGETFTSLAQGGRWRRPETPEVKTTEEHTPGTVIEGLVGGKEIQDRRNTRTAEAMRTLKEGADYTFKVGKPLQVRPPRV